MPGKSERITVSTPDTNLRSIGKLKFKKGHAAAVGVPQHDAYERNLDKAFVSCLKSDILLVQSKIDAVQTHVQRKSGDVGVTHNMMQLERTLLNIHPREDEAGQNEIKTILYELLLSKLKELFAVSSTGIQQARTEVQVAEHTEAVEWSLLLQNRPGEAIQKTLPPANLSSLLQSNKVAAFPGAPVAGLRAGSESFVAGMLDVVDVCANVLVGSADGVQPLKELQESTTPIKYYNTSPTESVGGQRRFDLGNRLTNLSQPSNTGNERVSGLGGGTTLPPLTGNTAATSQLPSIDTTAPVQTAALIGDGNFQRPPSSSSRPASRASSAPKKPPKVTHHATKEDRKTRHSSKADVDVSDVKVQELHEKLRSMEDRYNILKGFFAQTMTSGNMDTAVNGLNMSFLREFDDPRYADSLSQPPTSRVDTPEVPPTPVSKKSNKPGSRASEKKPLTNKSKDKNNKTNSPPPTAGAHKNKDLAFPDPDEENGDWKAQKDQFTVCIARQNMMLQKLQSHVVQLRTERAAEMAATAEDKRTLEEEREQMHLQIAAAEVRARQEVTALREEVEDAKREQKLIEAQKVEATRAKGKKLPTVTTKHDPPMLHEQEASYQQTISRKDRFIQELQAVLTHTQKDLNAANLRQHEFAAQNKQLQEELNAKKDRLDEISTVLKHKVKDESEMQNLVAHEKGLRELQMQRNVVEGEKTKNLEFEMIHVRRKLMESEEDFADYRKETGEVIRQQQEQITNLNQQLSKFEQKLRDKELEHRKMVTPLKASLEHFMKLAAHERMENKGHYSHLETTVQLQDKLHQVQHEFANWAAAKQIQQTSLTKQIEVKDGINKQLSNGNSMYLQKKLSDVTKERDKLQKEVAQLALRLSYQLKPNENNNAHHSRLKGMLHPNEPPLTEKTVTRNSSPVHSPETRDDEDQFSQPDSLEL